MPKISNINAVLALDVGTKRIGVAVADMTARLPRPLTTLSNDIKIFETIAMTAQTENAQAVVVGLPRGLDGQETEQTLFTREFAKELENRTGLNVYLQDEAVTSELAEHELFAKRKAYSKADVDALAATFILDDFLQSRGSIET